MFSPEISDSIGASLRGGGSLYSDAPCRDAQHPIMSHHIQVLYTTLQIKSSKFPDVCNNNLLITYLNNVRVPSHIESVLKISEYLVIYPI